MPERDGTGDGLPNDGSAGDGSAGDGSEGGGDEGAVGNGHVEARHENPFERYDIDPRRGPTAITERMRELAEAAPDEEARRHIRAAWEELTRHPARRLRAAFDAHPGGSTGGAAPLPPRLVSPPSPPLEPSDVVLRPSVVEALGLSAEAEGELPDAPPDADPILRP